MNNKRRYCNAPSAVDVRFKSDASKIVQDCLQMHDEDFKELYCTELIKFESNRVFLESYLDHSMRIMDTWMLYNTPYSFYGHIALSNAPEERGYLSRCILSSKHVVKVSK
ncbi:hypothetical protein TNCT_260041 [Trichonephila clavata]|uniref:Uncharacterized protein n=1 Tax=Trichonephila clavata TaxID=2740835 RepID=A0A8X6M0A1_TRICU|nr:hypothetical protein TNCT_260041 [Trichonephila clavata]